MLQIELKQLENKLFYNLSNSNKKLLKLEKELISKQQLRLFVLKLISEMGYLKKQSNNICLYYSHIKIFVLLVSELNAKF